MHVLQVETVFHEFGHALQHMLTKQDEGLVSGIRGIEWDAVELPSQFMENWCYHRYFSNQSLIFNPHWSFLLFPDYNVVILLQENNGSGKDEKNVFRWS